MTPKTVASPSNRWTLLMRPLLTANLSMMSKEAIQAFMEELECLPDTDQQLVLNFLAKLRRQRAAANARGTVPSSQPALAVKDGLLVFTGKLSAPDVDWV